jgi:hypothetical protein
MLKETKKQAERLAKIAEEGEDWQLSVFIDNFGFRDKERPRISYQAYLANRCCFGYGPTAKEAIDDIIKVLANKEAKQDAKTEL